MLRCVATCRALIVGSLLVVLAVCARSGTSVASTIQASTASRDAYAKALIPVAEAVLADFGRASVDDHSCLADQYIQGYTLRRLRAVGGPAIVRREMLKDTFDLNRFDVTEAQQTRILRPPPGNVSVSVACWTGRRGVKALSCLSRQSNACRRSSTANQRSRTPTSKQRSAKGMANRPSRQKRAFGVGSSCWSASPRRNWR